MSPQNSKDDVNPNGGSPTFITPEKDQTVCVVLDFRRLNKMLIMKPFPLRKISTTLMQLKGFTCATALDLNMGYYTIRIDAKASNMCTIILIIISKVIKGKIWQEQLVQTVSPRK